MSEWQPIGLGIGYTTPSSFHAPIDGTMLLCWSADGLSLDRFVEGKWGTLKSFDLLLDAEDQGRDRAGG